MSRLARLYPGAWRERYEGEFLALLAERPLGAFAIADVIRGALDAHLHPQVRRPGSEAPPPIPEADLLVARRLGFAAIAGTVLWVASFGVALIGPVRYDNQGAYRDGSAAFPLFILAALLLAGGLLGQLITLPRTARVARISALVATPCLILFGLGPWMFPFGVTAVVCVTWLGLAAGRAGEWSPVASAIVVGSGLAVLGVVAVATQVVGGDRMAGGVAFLVAGLAVVPAWLALGATLITRRAGAVRG